MWRSRQYSANFFSVRGRACSTRHTRSAAGAAGAARSTAICFPLCIRPPPPPARAYTSGAAGGSLQNFFPITGWCWNVRLLLWASSGGGPVPRSPVCGLFRGTGRSRPQAVLPRPCRKRFAKPDSALPLPGKVLYASSVAAKTRCYSGDWMHRTGDTKRGIGSNRLLAVPAGMVGQNGECRALTPGFIGFMVLAKQQYSIQMSLLLLILTEDYCPSVLNTGKRI